MADVAAVRSKKLYFSARRKEKKRLLGFKRLADRLRVRFIAKLEKDLKGVGITVDDRKGKEK